jgi:hypothetical protein
MEELLAVDIRINWMSKGEEELLAFLKAGISKSWMSYLLPLSTEELSDVVAHAHHIAHND